LDCGGRGRRALLLAEQERPDVRGVHAFVSMGMPWSARNRIIARSESR
jgi:hypothetical protein